MLIYVPQSKMILEKTLKISSGSMIQNKIKLIIGICLVGQKSIHLLMNVMVYRLLHLIDMESIFFIENRMISTQNGMLKTMRKLK
jgi:hypothetical protein